MSMTNGNSASRQTNKLTVILGAQWGDEGKGKLVDRLGQTADIVARCQGGNNAGHTVVVDGRTYDFHLLPCGLMLPGCIGVIGQGVVVHLPGLFEEITKNNIDDWQNRLIISDRAHIVLNVHQMVDGLSESTAQVLEKLPAFVSSGIRTHVSSGIHSLLAVILITQTLKIGTTKRGIGPAYSSKAWRNGIRIGTLVKDWDLFKQRYLGVVEFYKAHFKNLEVDTDDELKQFQDYRKRLIDLKLVRDTSSYVNGSLKAGKSVLVEAANGVLLDIDHGTYPFVTSSSCSAGVVCTGLGVPPSRIGTIIGIAKAYQTRVGDGPFPTEQDNDLGSRLRSIGGEFGVTTGRPRRCGWLDLFLLKYSAMLNGYTGFALTKMDCLDEFDQIQVGIGYKLNGKEIESPPSEAEEWERVEVMYKTMPGWKCSTKNVRNFDDLPQKAKEYVQLVEKMTDTPVKFIGVGKDRNAIIIR